MNLKRRSGTSKGGIGGLASVRPEREPTIRWPPVRIGKHLKSESATGAASLCSRRLVARCKKEKVKGTGHQLVLRSATVITWVASMS